MTQVYRPVFRFLIALTVSCVNPEQSTEPLTLQFSLNLNKFSPFLSRHRNTATAIKSSNEEIWVLAMRNITDLMVYFVSSCHPLPHGVTKLCVEGFVRLVVRRE